MAGDGTVTLSWTKPAKADSYQVQIFPQSTSCASPYAICPAAPQATSTYTFYPNASAGSLYTVNIRPVNTTCGTDYGSWCASNFTVMGTIRVNFYLDNTGQAASQGDMCQLAGAAGVNPGTGARLTAQGQSSSYNGTISGSTGSVAVPYWPAPASNLVTLLPGEAAPGQAYRCTCPQSCQYSGIASPQSGVNFFVAALDLTRSGWWQAVGGNVLAYQSSGMALNDPIPTTACSASPACKPFIIRQDKNDTQDSAGIALTGGGSVDSSDENGFQTGYVTDRAAQTFAVGVSSKRKENYDYFYRLYSMGANPGSSDDFVGSSRDARKPTGEPSGSKRAYFHEGDLTIQQPWSVASNEKLVIFVHGNLTLADPAGVGSLVDVAEGGFLAFIVSGNITIESSVGNTDLDSTASNVEGVYIADGILSVESWGAAAGGDRRFIGEGTFVGWSGVALERDFSDGGARKAENNTHPAETFVYRPDFVVNVPERMTKPVYVWQETN